MTTIVQRGNLIRRLFPIAGWLPGYRRQWLRADLVAGLAIWAVTVPQALAYAGIAGVPAQYGLYSVPLAMFAYAIFGTSRLLSVGPDSATAILSFAVVSTLGAPSESEFIALTAALAMLVGVIYVLFGLLRLGWMSTFITIPVMKGFVQALALIVIIGQLPKMFGLSSVDGNFFQQLFGLIRELPELNLATTVVGIGSLVLILLIRRFLPKVLASIVVVALAILISSIFDLAEAGVAVVGTIESGFPGLAFPDVSRDQLVAMIGGALAIVLVGYTESLGAAKAAVIDEEIDANRELVALGLANFGSGLSSGFVAAGSLSRTSFVRSTGGRTQIVSIVNGLLVVLTILILMPMFTNLPQATLGAVVVAAMIGVLDLDYFRRLFTVSRTEFIISFVAFLGVLTVGILAGVLVGIILSVLQLIHRGAQPGTAVLGRMPDEETYRDITLHPEAQTMPELLIFRFDSALYFLNAEYFVGRVEEHIAKSEVPIGHIIVNASTINFIDITGAEALAKLKIRLSERNITLALAYVKDPVRVSVTRNGLEMRLGAENFYESVHDAVVSFIGSEEL